MSFNKLIYFDLLHNTYLMIKLSSIAQKDQASFSSYWSTELSICIMYHIWDGYLNSDALGPRFKTLSEN